MGAKKKKSKKPNSLANVNPPTNFYEKLNSIGKLIPLTLFAVSEAQQPFQQQLQLYKEAIAAKLTAQKSEDDLLTGFPKLPGSLQFNLENLEVTASSDTILSSTVER